MIRTVLTDAQWAAIAPHCLGRECDPGHLAPIHGCSSSRALDRPHRLSVARLAAQFGKWNTVFKQHRRWMEADAFHIMFRVLAEDADFEYVMVDGTIVKVHPPWPGRKKGD